MKKILLFICLPFWSFCQNTIGFPDIVNYSKQTYSAGLQNWDIKQDNNGIVYFANNEGLLSFNGKNWQLYPLPNKTIVRSVEIGTDNRIYVGGQDELGYFAPAANGYLQYYSLTKFILPKDRSFGDVWDIVSFHKDIFFRSTSKIFKLTNEAVETYNASSEWTCLTACNGTLYAHDERTGLKRYENGAWSPLFPTNQLLINDPVTAILPLHQDSALITTLKHGLFMLSAKGITKIASSNNLLFQNARIYAATKINDEWVALATSNSGVYIIDTKGDIIQSFSKTFGLQNNNVLSIYLDKQSNLWLGLDNGVDLINYNSAIKQIYPLMQDASGYTATIFNNKLYIGTSSGLFSVALQQSTDLSFSKGDFVPVGNASGQVWGLTTINNQLLLSTHEGAFVVKDNTAVPVVNYPGYWNFLPLSNTFPSAEMVGGNYNGLTFFNASNQQFTKLTDVPGFNESSRFMAIDKYDNIWVSHPYHGVFKIYKKPNGSYTSVAYKGNAGLPSQLNNHVFKVKNEVVFATEKGIYNYNAQANKLEPSAFYNGLLGTQSIRYLKEDVAGNIWFIHEKTLGVIDFTGKEPTVIYLPEFHDKLLSGFEFIYPVNQNNIFIGGNKGMFHLNYEKYKKNMPDLRVQIREVRIADKTDSLLFGGYFKEVNEVQTQNANAIPEVTHNWKTIRFEYSASLFGYETNIEYSFHLKGFDNNWSEWTKRTEKEYTNLPQGSYTFEMKVRNNLGKESPVATYAFKMLPPWYQTIWAYLLCLVAFVLFNYGLFLFLKNKFRQQKAKYEKEQERLLYIYELEKAKTDSELIGLRNEKLESDINFKNSELASSAMHLLKKGELLSKMKGELAQIMKEIDNQHAIAALKKMIKTLSEDEHMDEEWENFTNHFDKVHSDFLSELKELHPGITANELKLSAYLRMNLTTKEIAQLMNISVRGVEIGRYRLRKKLAIQSEMSLFDYLSGIKTKG
ncbi:triple tyrosine motif-containing protein [Parasediminibacterium sp. JCM 36343]|uniref:ligand-binding sensor domain-containing protein n=1 Tax=Parasediminibacterium sp. JCM 36343 TaxID=3374279 RepID=UPI00397C4AF4